MLFITVQRVGGDLVWLDGETISLKQLGSVLDAWELVVCDIGMACDQRNHTLIATCVFDGPCYDSRFERVKQETAFGDEARYQEILRYYCKKGDAIRRNDVNAFMNPNCRK